MRRDPVSRAPLASRAARRPAEPVPAAAPQPRVPVAPGPGDRNRLFRHRRRPAPPRRRWTGRHRASRRRREPCTEAGHRPLGDRSMLGDHPVSPLARRLTDLVRLSPRHTAAPVGAMRTDPRAEGTHTLPGGIQHDVQQLPHHSPTLVQPPWRAAQRVMGRPRMTPPGRPGAGAAPSAPTAVPQHPTRSPARGAARRRPGREPGDDVVVDAGPGARKGDAAAVGAVAGVARVLQRLQRPRGAAVDRPGLCAGQRRSRLRRRR